MNEDKFKQLTIADDYSQYLYTDEFHERTQIIAVTLKGNDTWYNIGNTPCIKTTKFIKGAPFQLVKFQQGNTVSRIFFFNGIKVNSIKYKCLKCGREFQKRQDLFIKRVYVDRLELCNTCEQIFNDLMYFENINFIDELIVAVKTKDNVWHKVTINDYTVFLRVTENKLRLKSILFQGEEVKYLKVKCLKCKKERIMLTYVYLNEYFGKNNFICNKCIPKDTRKCQKLFEAAEMVDLEITKIKDFYNNWVDVTINDYRFVHIEYKGNQTDQIIYQDKQADTYMCVKFLKFICDDCKNEIETRIDLFRDYTYDHLCTACRYERREKEKNLKPGKDDRIKAVLYKDEWVDVTKDDYQVRYWNHFKEGYRPAKLFYKDESIEKVKVICEECGKLHEESWYKYKNVYDGGVARCLICFKMYNLAERIKPQIKKYKEENPNRLIYSIVEVTLKNGNTYEVKPEECFVLPIFMFNKYSMSVVYNNFIVESMVIKCKCGKKISLKRYAFFKRLKKNNFYCEDCNDELKKKGRK